MTDLEVLEGEVIEDSHEYLPAVVDQRVVPALTLEEAATSFALAERLKHDIMRNGVDYGTIPGAKKPSLWKPGAERAGQFYGLSHRMVRVDAEKDDDGRNWGITYRCEVFKVLPERTVEIASCEGYASYDEDRFWDSKYEWDDKAKKKLPKRDEAGEVIKSRSPWNTVLKMADKRAFVGAVIKACGLSDAFTQDVEDYGYGSNDSIPDRHQPRPPAAPEFLAPQAVVVLTDSCASRGMTDVDIERLVESVTNDRCCTFAECFGSEYPALKNAIKAFVTAPGSDVETLPVDGAVPREEEKVDTSPNATSELPLGGELPLEEPFGDPAVEKIDDKHRRMLFASLRSIGVGNDDRHSWASHVLGREVASFSDIRMVEVPALFRAIDETKASKGAKPRKDTD